MKCVQFQQEGRYIKDFVRLYHTLYDKNRRMQNDTELMALLKEQHLFSKYFRLHKFCIYRDNGIVGRFVLTEYPEDDTLYLGFFECIDDSEVASFLFSQAEKYARESGYRKIMGPVDASFWLGYRLKINRFDGQPYTGEPYNQSYYLKLFTENGYSIAEHYSSSIYPSVADAFENHTYSDRYQQMVQQGYTFLQPTLKQWDQTISEIYKLITALYRGFPIYKDLSEADFKTYFESYKKIINFDMVRMAYFQGQAVGFYISIPNYNNLVYHTKNVFNIFRILRLRKSPKEYVMLYMGVDKEHKGLGKALVQSIMDTLKAIGLPSIGALQRDGNITQTYVGELIEGRYEYVLLSREV